MTSLKATAQAALEKMVRGAVADVERARESASGATPLPPETAAALHRQVETKGKSVQRIPIALIRLDENVRRRYDEAAMAALVVSLQADGLIQMPTVCLRRVGEASELICRNGHRRIMAAKRLGWTHIDCVVLSFESARDELYHVINANLREDVFYLDLARSYEDAAQLGESDAEIARRVGVHVRTVGWYRRLAQMPAPCERLVRDHPQLFNATWAVKVARCGALPAADFLFAQMQEMVHDGRAWIPGHRSDGVSARDADAPRTSMTTATVTSTTMATSTTESAPPPPDPRRPEALAALRKLLSGPQHKSRTLLARTLIGLLHEGGYLSAAARRDLERELWPARASRG